MVSIVGGFTESAISDRWIVCAKRRSNMLHRKYLLYDTGCTTRSHFHFHILGPEPAISDILNPICYKSLNTFCEK